MNQDTNRVEVLLDIYSGRPNPRWPLSSAQIGDLSARLNNQPDAQPVEPPGLGYRGFIVRNGARDPRLPAELRVYNGVISSTVGGARRIIRDTAGVEEWLIAQAREQGQGAALDALRGGGALA